MKKILYIIVLTIVSINGYSQKKHNSTFSFGNQIIKYSSYSYAKRNISNFYIICYDDRDKLKKIINDIEMCFVNHNQNTKFYFLLIPKKIKDIKQKEKLFLEFLSDVVNRTKLIDSNLFIISNDDYTNLYREIKKERSNKYKYGYLNDIKDIFIENDPEICKITK